MGEIIAVFRMKYVKPQSMATARRKFQKLVFNPAIHKLDLLNELQKLAKDALGIAGPCHHRANDICHIATTPEEINKPGPLVEWHV